MLENQTGYKVKTLRSDRGGEFKSREFAEFLQEKGISHETSAPQISQQNGRAERINRTLREKSESMRHHSGAPKIGGTSQ